jgi:uncharacterized MAPEG superfamily protein
MTVAYACILIAALLPYLWTAVYKSSGVRYDNRNPRAWLAKQEDPRLHRASNAQLNAFEAFAPFAAAVLMAQAAGVDAAQVSWLAIAFVALRLLHGVFYLANKALLRSLVWAGGLACVIALMVQAIVRISG